MGETRNLEAIARRWYLPAEKLFTLCFPLGCPYHYCQAVSPALVPKALAKACTSGHTRWMVQPAVVEVQGRWGADTLGSQSLP